MSNGERLQIPIIENDSVQFNDALLVVMVSRSFNRVALLGGPAYHDGPNIRISRNQVPSWN
jgi:hypothetical protein